MRIRHALVMLLGVLASGQCFGADEIRCVDTSDELLSALYFGGDPSNSVEIRIVQSDLPYEVLLQDFALTDVMIKGGYPDTSCAEGNRVVDALNTPVTLKDVGGDTYVVLRKKLAIDGIALNLDNSVRFSVDIYTTTAVDVRIRNSVVLLDNTDLPSPLFAPLAFQSDDVPIDVTFESSLVLSRASGNVPRCAITFDATEAKVGVNLINNTFIDRADPTIGADQHATICLSSKDEEASGGSFDDENGSIELIATNNIFDWINSNTATVFQEDYLLNQPDEKISATFRNNLIKGPGAIDLDNFDVFDSIVGDPAYFNKATGNYRLTFNSVARDSGTIAAIGDPDAVDLDGLPRVSGASNKPDLGAYELQQAPSDVIKVNSTGDAACVPGGFMTLRCAIDLANNTAGKQKIDFSEVPGACPRSIVLGSPLPDITGPLAIAGFTAIGATPNSATFGDNANLCIRIAGGLAVDRAIRVPAGTDRTLNVSGIKFVQFLEEAVLLEGGEGHTLTGNHFGDVGFDGNAKHGVRVGAFANSVTIGGEAPAAQNLFSNNLQNYALTVASDYNDVLYNLFGTGRSGEGIGHAARNGRGILIASSALQNDITGNTISDSLDEAIYVSGNYNLISKNLVGWTDKRSCAASGCSTQLPNGKGIIVTGTGNRFVGNDIANNNSAGILLNNGVSNQIAFGNTFSNNNGLGIDIFPVGVAAIDNDFTSVGNVPNDGQNFPVITFAKGPKPAGAFAPALGTVKGKLSSRPGGYAIELFASLSCDGTNGEGAVPIGSSPLKIEDDPSVPEGQNQIATFQIDVQANAFFGLIGRYITATARGGGNNTSEFSACFLLTEQVPPTLANAAFDIDENSPIDAPVGSKMTAIDPDAEPDSLVYTIETADVPFKIDAVSGQISVNGPIDFETKPSYSLSVKVVDTESQSATATVTITVKNKSEIGAQQFFLQFDDTPTAGGTPIGYALNKKFGTVTAEFGANKTFQIVGGSDTFAIGTASGDLTLIKTPAFPAPPAAAQLQFTVEVDDGNGAKGMAVMTVVADRMFANGFEN